MLSIKCGGIIYIPEIQIAHNIITLLKLFNYLINVIVRIILIFLVAVLVFFLQFHGLKVSLTDVSRLTHRVLHSSIQATIFVHQFHYVLM